MDARVSDRTRQPGGLGSSRSSDPCGRKGLIAATNDDPEAYIPARSIETISLRETLDAAHRQDDRPISHGAIRKINADIEQAITNGKTLKDLVLADEPYLGPDIPSSAETRATDRA